MNAPPPPLDGRGRLIVVSGPSGVGKSAVVGRLLADPRFSRAVTATTREPRPGERDRVDYFFFTRDQFLACLKQGWFLEYADVYGKFYGTPRSSVEEVLDSGRHCVLVIDTQGAASLRQMGIEAVFVFLEPPSRDELLRRLTARGGDSPESVERRVREARREMAQAVHFTHRIVNDEVETTARRIASAVGVELA